MSEENKQKIPSADNNREEELREIREEIKELSKTRSDKWAASNILFVIFTFIAGGLIGYLFDYFTETRKEEQYKLAVASSIGPNLTEWDSYAREKVTITYDTGSGQELPVASYFHIQSRILNTGNRKLENLTIRFKLNKEMHLIKSPQYKIYPTRERPYVTMNQIHQPLKNEDEWIISELRPDEYVDFTYLAVSDKTVRNPMIAVTPKEPKDKNYEVSYEDEISIEEKKRESFLRKKFEDFTGFDIFMVILTAEIPLVYLLVLSLSMYMRYRRKTRERLLTRALEFDMSSLK